MPNGQGDHGDWPDWTELLRRGCTCVELNDLGVGVPKPGITGWGGHGADAYPSHDPDPDCPLHAPRSDFTRREGGSVELPSIRTDRICGVRIDGVYRRKRDSALFKVVGIQQHPSMTLRKIHPAGDEEVAGAIGSPLFQDYIELIPEDETIPETKGDA